MCQQLTCSDVYRNITTLATERIIKPPSKMFDEAAHQTKLTSVPEGQ
jgi:hypothetical protein